MECAEWAPPLEPPGSPLRPKARKPSEASLVARGAAGPMQLAWRCEEKAAADGSLIEELRAPPPSTALGLFLVIVVRGRVGHRG